jgi:hypothetical protein
MDEIRWMYALKAYKKDFRHYSTDLLSDIRHVKF